MKSGNETSQSARWGEDWLMAACSLFMSGRAAEGPIAGCSLDQAARALNLAAPMPASASASARLAARCDQLLHVVDLLAARARGRGCDGVVVITPVRAAREPDEGPIPAGAPVRLRQIARSATGTGRWQAVDAGAPTGDDTAGPARVLAAWIASCDADDVYLYFDASFDAPVAGTASLPRVTAPGFTDLKQDESWLVPLPGAAVAAGESIDDGLASPAATRAVRIRAYGELPATDAELRLVDALDAAARARRALGLNRAGARGASGPATWSCHPIDGGDSVEHDSVWPLRVFPRTDAGHWPALVLVADDAGWVPAVVDVVDEAHRAHVARPMTRRIVPDDADRAVTIDLWDVPGARDRAHRADEAPSDVLELSEKTGCIVLRATEVRRTRGGAGNVVNKLAVLAEHGWTEEDAGDDEEGRAVRVWRSGAPLTIVGFAALWRYISSFGSSVLIEEPMALRERHVRAASARLTRFAERFAERSGGSRDGRTSRESDEPTR